MLLKTHKRYWFYRIYCPIGLALFFINPSLLHLGPSFRDLFLAMSFVSIFMFGQLFIFPAPFSIFGRYQRTPFPNEEAIITRWSIGEVLVVGGPLGLRVYPSGLGVSLIGRAFIPLKNIVDIKENKITWTIEHNSPEIYSPITIINSKIANELQKLLTQKSNSTQSQA